MTLDEAVAGLVGRRVLVALDFDGTLSEIVEHPDQVEPVAGAVDALARLAGYDDVEVSVISGRRLEDLRRFLGPPPGVTIVGEHGAAWEGIEVPAPPGFDEVRVGLESVVSAVPGAWVEVKSTSLVVHTRQVPPEQEPELVSRVSEFLASRGLDPEHGKRVLDIGFVDASKGAAVDRLRNDLAVEHVMFAGDDTTDESVFYRLLPGDVGVRVGDGPSSARHRLSGPAEVVGLLERFARLVAADLPSRPA